MMVLLVVRSFWIYFIMDWRVTTRADSRLNAELNALETQLDSASSREELRRVLDRYADRHGDLNLEVVAPGRQVLYRGPPKADDVELSTEGSQPGSKKRSHITRHTSDGRHRAVIAEVPSSIGPLEIELSRSTQDKRNETWDFASTLLTTLPLVFAAAVGVGYFVSSRALTPVDKMISDAKRITARQLDQRIDVPESQDELARLAQTLNEMINGLHRSFEEMRRFTADAAHDLRTPVAALRTEVEVTLMSERSIEEYRNSLQTILDEAIHLSRLTNQLLDLSREDFGLPPTSSEPARVDDLLTTAMDDLRMAAHQKRITIDVHHIGPWTVLGDPIRLRRVFMNLLDNAIQYAPYDGRIQVDGEYLPDRAVLTISDNGPGIPAEELPHIFDRFRRVDKARNRQMGGTGLGLAICKSIVEAHGGRIRMESAVGEGTRVIVELPRERKNTQDRRASGG
jgi:heavy metal sensor kinase